MSHPHTPFIINLDKHPHGYTFHSLEEASPLASKLKKQKIPIPKSNHNKTTNRLIKQIGYIGEIPPIIPEEITQPKESILNQEEIARQELELQQEEEEIDCQVKRNIQLPPSPALWFNSKDIHTKQKQYFPQFFTAKSYKVAQLYTSYRNFMVEAYQKNPNRYLTFISCRRVLRGDANCLLKIYNFLNGEGIINYCVNYQGNYTFQSSNIDKSNQTVKKAQSCFKKMPLVSEQERGDQIDTDNLTVTVINKNFSRTFRVYCSNCKLICGIVWFASIIDDQKQKNLCFDCYNRLGKEESAGFSKVDILKKMQNSKDIKIVNKTSWGLDDNIKLLQFMGNSAGKSWNELIQQFQSKKTLQDIIIQFMQFPITNFDPNQYQTQLVHKQIHYQQQEHIQLLQQLYDNSAYANVMTGQQINGQGKEREDSQEERKSSENTGKFKTFTRLILDKYVGKINQLNKIQKLIQTTNLSVNEQPLCKRVRLTRQTEATPEQQYQDYQLNLNDDQNIFA